MSCFCVECGKKITEPIWVADYHEYDNDKSPHVWRDNPIYGRALQKGHCPFCGSDRLVEATP